MGDDWFPTFGGVGRRRFLQIGGAVTLGAALTGCRDGGGRKGSQRGHVTGIHINVKDDYGAVGNGSTNDTTAFNNAIAAVKAAAVGYRPYIYVPEGRYILSPLNTIDFSGLRIVGAGADRGDENGGGTQLRMTGSSGSLFTLGTYDSTPASLWEGTAEGFTLESLGISGNEANMAGEGSRTNTAITDNGSGSLYLRNVSILGCRYGVKANYGSDISRYDFCFFTYCDVAMYLGEASNQNMLTGVNVMACREGIVTEGVSHLTIEHGNFIDPLLSAVQIEKLATPRSGLATSENFRNEGSIVISDTLFESGAGYGDGNRQPANGHVRTYSDADSSYPRGVHIRNPRLVSGGSGTPSWAFFHVETGRFHTLTDLAISGSQIDSVVKRGTNGAHILQERTRTGDGSTVRPLWRNRDESCIYRGASGDANEFANGDTTPDVSGETTSQTWTSDATYFQASNSSPTSITNFDKPYRNQRIVVRFTNGNTTIVNGSTIKNRSGANLTPATDTVYEWVYQGGAWYEVG
jgi:Pectate lyase superfamily protein